jgi:hypothetical protein
VKTLLLFLALPLFAAEQRVVDGVVFNRLTKAPVSGAAINPGDYRAKSDAAGAFRLVPSRA